MTAIPIGPADLPGGGALSHSAGCPGPELSYLDDDRGRALRCNACGRTKSVHGRLDEHARRAAGLIPDDEPSHDESAVTDAAEPPKSSPWWCREHDRPVSWRGTGCAECAREHRTRQQQRAERAARRKEARRPQSDPIFVTQ